MRRRHESKRIHYSISIVPHYIANSRVGWRLSPNKVSVSDWAGDRLLAGKCGLVCGYILEQELCAKILSVTVRALEEIAAEEVIDYENQWNILGVG